MEQKKDNRVKFSNEIKNEIIARYKAGGVSMYRLAKEYGTCSTYVSFLIDPEKLEKNRKNKVNREKARQRLINFRERKREKLIKMITKNDSK